MKLTVAITSEEGNFSETHEVKGHAEMRAAMLELISDINSDPITDFEISFKVTIK